MTGEIAFPDQFHEPVPIQFHQTGFASCLDGGVARRAGQQADLAEIATRTETVDEARTFSRMYCDIDLDFAVQDHVETVRHIALSYDGCSGRIGNDGNLGGDTRNNTAIEGRQDHARPVDFNRNTSRGYRSPFRHAYLEPIGHG